MIKPKKRLSAGMGLSADGIDPLFEFDVPRIFVDLTMPPRYTRATPNDHDPWFDLVHEQHSRPTEEFLAAHEHEHKPSSENTTLHRPVHPSHGAQHLDTDGEKENSGGAARRKRRNVAYRVKDAAPVDTLKTTMRTVSATNVTVKPSSGPAKKSTKLPFGNSSTTVMTPANKQGTSTKSGGNTMPRKRPGVDRSTESSKARSRTLPTGTRKTGTSTTAEKDLHDLQALLAKHNKKFKTNHTYEPRQHSVRDVRMWEKKTQKSYYKLTLEDRFQANEEITQLVRERDSA